MNIPISRSRWLGLLVVVLLAACNNAAPVDCKCQSSANLVFSNSSADYSGQTSTFTAPTSVTLTGNIAVEGQVSGSVVRKVNIAILSPVAGQTYAIKSGLGSDGSTVGYREGNSTWVANSGSVRVDAVNTTDGIFTFTLTNIVLTPSSNTNEPAKGSVTLNGTIAVTKLP